MKVYTDHTDTFAARDLDHLHFHLAQMYDDHDVDEIIKNFEEVDLDKEMKIFNEDTGQSETKKVREWIADMPDGGFVCSTEF